MGCDGELASGAGGPAVRRGSAAQPSRGPRGYAGRWNTARARAELGCPYEAALALAGADDDEPCAARWGRCSDWALGRRRRLWRAACASAVPGGCRADRALKHKQNPANLTSRQVEVLETGRAGPAKRRHSGAAVPLREDRSPTTCRRSCASSRSPRAARRARPPCGSGSSAKIGSLARSPIWAACPMRLGVAPYLRLRLRLGAMEDRNQRSERYREGAR